MGFVRATTDQTNTVDITDLTYAIIGEDTHAHHIPRSADPDVRPMTVDEIEAQGGSHQLLCYLHPISGQALVDLWAVEYEHGQPVEHDQFAEES